MNKVFIEFELIFAMKMLNKCYTLYFNMFFIHFFVERDQFKPFCS